MLPARKGQITATWNVTTIPAGATGYQLARVSGGTTQETFILAGRSTVTYADVTAGNGTFTYSLLSTASSWQSSTVTANVTRSC